LTAAEAQAVRNEAAQTELDRIEIQYAELFGPIPLWSESVLSSYRTDLHIARRRAEGWATNPDFKASANAGYVESLADFGARIDRKRVAS
jgi:hypothetical protein